MAALLIRTFRPSSPTIFSTSWAFFSKVSNFVVSALKSIHFSDFL
jgi:hypothetical protein